MLKKGVLFLSFIFKNIFSQLNCVKSTPFEPLNCCAEKIAIFLLYKDHSQLAFIPSVSTSKGLQNILNRFPFICQGHFVPRIFMKQKLAQSL